MGASGQGRRPGPMGQATAPEATSALASANAFWMALVCTTW